MFGCVLSNEIKFFDYRFPKTGILSIEHNEIIPPD